MPEQQGLPPYTVDLNTAKNYVSAFRTGYVNEGEILEPITPAQQQDSVLNNYWAPENPVKTGLDYDYANAPSCLTMQAFTFALSDITDLLNRIRLYNGLDPIPHIEPERANPVTGIRFYLGMKPNPAYTPAMPVGPQFIPCLVFLPVANFVPGRWVDGVYASPQGGEDLVSLPGLNEENTADSGELSALYDFSFPCPDTCAVNAI